MPWGSWITCEETVNGPDVGPDFTGASNVPLTQRHGFIFEVPGAGSPTGSRSRAAGRFAHEAVAFDPKRRDPLPDRGQLRLPLRLLPLPPGHATRWRPARSTTAAGSRCWPSGAAERRSGGRAAAPGDVPTSSGWTSTTRRRRFPYTPGQAAPTTNNQALSYVGSQGCAQGAAYFSRLEGSAYDSGVVYFSSTQGGGPAETALRPDRRRLRQRHGPDLGVPHACREAAAALPVARARRRWTSRTTSRRSPRGTLSCARTTSTTTTCAG